MYSIVIIALALFILIPYSLLKATDSQEPEVPQFPTPTPEEEENFNEVWRLFESLDEDLKEEGVKSQARNAFFSTGSTECYDTSDLLEILAEYGSVTPKISPTWNGYFQDASCTIANWEYIGTRLKPEGGFEFKPDGLELISWDVSSPVHGDVLNFTGTTGGTKLKFVRYNENCPEEGQWELPCNGTYLTSITVKYGKATYRRSGLNFAQVNDHPNGSCDTGYPPFTTDPTTFHEFDETGYNWLVDSGLKWDLNGDHKVDTLDLLEFLAGYGC